MTLPCKVLVVDDDRRLCRIISCLLRKSGHKVAIACSIKDALSKLEEMVPDVVLLDMMLSDGNGCELCKEVKAGDRPPRVCFLTGRSLPEDVERMKEAGADGHIVKPFSSTRLARLVDSLRKGGTRCYREESRQAKV